MPPENYYRPFCCQCRTYVQPQVIAVTTISGYGSRTDYGKCCPICGDPVASQADRDARQVSIQNQILLMGIGSLFCFVLAIPMFLAAARHRPLNAAGKAGVTIATLNLLFYLTLFPLMILVGEYQRQMRDQERTHMTSLERQDRRHVHAARHRALVEN